MRVMLLTERSGNPPQCTGDLVDVPEDEARRLIADGQARMVDPAAEKAIGRRSFETASVRHHGSKRK